MTVFMYVRRRACVCKCVRVNTPLFLGPLSDFVSFPVLPLDGSAAF